MNHERTFESSDRRASFAVHDRPVPRVNPQHVEGLFVHVMDLREPPSFMAAEIEASPYATTRMPSALDMPTLVPAFASPIETGPFSSTVTAALTGSDRHDGAAAESSRPPRTPAHTVTPSFPGSSPVPGRNTTPAPSVEPLPRYPLTRPKRSCFSKRRFSVPENQPQHSVYTFPGGQSRAFNATDDGRHAIVHRLSSAVHRQLFPCAGSSTRTETFFETPFSCIVMP